MHSLAILLLLLASTLASWFGSSPDYSKWTHTQLQDWLASHNIKVPSSFSESQLIDLVHANWDSTAAAATGYVDASKQWSYDQYNRAQKSFVSLKDDSFDTWDESKLREWLLEQGVVAPSGPREQLILLAKQKYRSYADAASYYSSLASASASSVYADVSDSGTAMSKSASSVVAQATREAGRAFDESKDYVYLTLDDDTLRNWLADKGVVAAKNAKSRPELLALVRDYYTKATEPIWTSWSDSYIREWLAAHNIINPDTVTPRDTLLQKMSEYYYNVSDAVWSTWSDSKLKQWCVDHGLVKSDEQVGRDKLVKLVQENYASAADSVWGAWSDSDIRSWLVEHGYAKSDKQMKRDELVKLINSKCTDTSQRAAAYLTWPDARLRAYLRESGVISEEELPGSREELLQKVRTAWVQPRTRAEGIFNKLRDIINGTVEAAEEKLARILEVLSGHTNQETAKYTNEKWTEANDKASEKGNEYAEKAERASEKAKETLSKMQDEL